MQLPPCKGVQKALNSFKHKKATSGQNHHKAKEKHKHSPNSPVEYKLWAEEHCRSLRRLGSKASTPLWLWAELPTSNTEPLSGKTPLGCAWKCQRMCTKRHQALELHRISELPAHCKCREAERNDSVRARAGTAGWPQMCPNSQFFLAPCSNFRPWERIFPKAPELPQFTFCFCSCFHSSPLRQGVAMGWLKCPPNIHSQQKCHPNKSEGAESSNTKTSGKKYSTGTRKETPRKAKKDPEIRTKDCASQHTWCGCL